MLLRALTFLVWAAVAGSAAYWGLKLFVTPLRAPTQTAVAPSVAPPAGDLTRLFGAEPVAPPPESLVAAAPAMESRFQLIGVVAPRAQASGGVALIAVDGKQPKAFRVGTAVDGETVLQGVQPRGATLGLGGGPVQVALQLPPLPTAATGTLPPPINGETPPTPFPSPAALPGRQPGAAMPGRMPFGVPMPAQPGALQPRPMPTPGQQQLQSQAFPPQGYQQQAGQPDHSPGAPQPGSLESVQNPFTAMSPETAAAVEQTQRRFGRSANNANQR